MSDLVRPDEDPRTEDVLDALHEADLPDPEEAVRGDDDERAARDPDERLAFEEADDRP